MLKDKEEMIIDDVKVTKELSGADIIRNNVVEINTKSKDEFLTIQKVRDKILKRIEEQVDKLDIDKLIKVFNQLANIGLTQIELTNDLVNPKNNNNPIILQTPETSSKDHIEEYINEIDSHSLKRIDGFMKMMETIKKSNSENNDK